MCVGRSHGWSVAAAVKSGKSKSAFADPRVTYTKSFQQYALELSRYMTIKDVAEHLEISWDVIKDIQKADLRSSDLTSRKLSHLRQIAIDEISDRPKGTPLFDNRSGPGKWSRWCMSGKAKTAAP